MAEPYERLIEHSKAVATLGSSAAVLGWDQETTLPPGGVEHRARQLAQLAELCHEWSTRPAVGEWLSACEADAELDPDAAQPNVRELRREYDRATKLPKDLVAALAETTSLAQHAWAEARRASDFAAFEPWLTKVVGLVRRKAECLGHGDGGEPWDALADGFEPGLTGQQVEVLFAPLRQRLRALLDALLGASDPPGTEFAREVLPIDAQERFVRRVVAAIGFDFERGRLDRSTHPFTIGIHPHDVRITTRFADDNLLDALGSTLHEGGHALYEQGLRAEHFGTPLGATVSLGIHESQSRLWENHVGRSAPFWRWCHPLLGEFFGDSLARYDADAVFRAANRVEPSLIRVEADEVTYDLHVMLRTDLERALLRGDLAPADVPAAWNEGFRALLGTEVPDDRRGCLQDVHWSCGLIGYFPTYTLGNLYAAQLWEAATRDLPDLDGQIALGEFGPLREWLRTSVHAHGQRWSAADLCVRATGAPLSAEPYLHALESKLNAVYRL